MGLLPIVLPTDADVARASCHKERSGNNEAPGRWLQEQLQRKGDSNAVKTMLKGMLAAKITAFLARIAGTLLSWVTTAIHVVADEFVLFLLILLAVTR